MRTIYIDDDFKCHVDQGENLRPIETTLFDGKCREYIEGFRIVPLGESWTREDGTVFSGEMVSTIRDYSELDEAQREYERELLAEYAEALKTLGVTV